MLVLHTMPQIGWGLLNPSPFCLKTEVYLRMLGVPYEKRPTLSTRGAPMGKLPWIESDGQRLADSAAIEAYVRRVHAAPDREEHASPTERAQAHLVRRTFEESLYFAIVSERWRSPPVRDAYAADLLRGMPAPLRPLVRRVAERMLLRQLWQQGYGRHPLERVLHMGGDDLDAIGASLGAREFFGGDAPRALDACAFGFLANVHYTPVRTQLGGHLARHANLVAYVERMRARYASDVPVPPG